MDWYKGASRPDPKNSKKVKLGGVRYCFKKVTQDLEFLTHEEAIEDTSEELLAQTKLL